MNINWFPGHMTKSLRMMSDNIKLVDAVIYMLDARAPLSCINPSLDGMAGNKPILYVLNKVDLVDDVYAKKVCAHFAGEGKKIITLNSTVSKSTAAIAGHLKALCADKLERAKNKGISIVIRAMVVGIPNCGKSTFINNLCGAGKTATGNKAGVTRGKQWVKIDPYLEVLDTPGTLYPKIVDQEKAQRLAFIGGINDDVLDKITLALMLAKSLDAMDLTFINVRYRIENGSPETRLEDIAKSRGFIQRGGLLDTEKAAHALIDDFRKGRLGKIAFDSLP